MKLPLRQLISFNENHTAPTKIIQRKPTIPQQKSSNENLLSFNKDHPMKQIGRAKKWVELRALDETAINSCFSLQKTIIETFYRDSWSVLCYFILMCTSPYPYIFMVTTCTHPLYSYSLHTVDIYDYLDLQVNDVVYMYPYKK